MCALIVLSKTFVFSFFLFFSEEVCPLIQEVSEDTSEGQNIKEVIQSFCVSKCRKDDDNSLYRFYNGVLDSGNNITELCCRTSLLRHVAVTIRRNAPLLDFSLRDAINETRRDSGISEVTASSSSWAPAALPSSVKPQKPKSWDDGYIAARHPSKKRKPPFIPTLPRHQRFFHNNLSHKKDLWEL